MLDNNVISYASRKQDINSLSTCEAEYVAMAEATKDLMWLAGLCKELGWKHPVLLLLGDNQCAIVLNAKPVRLLLLLRRLRRLLRCDATSLTTATRAKDKDKDGGDRVGVLFGERIAASCSCRSRYQALISVIKESVGYCVDYIAGIK
ncbi:hypothetical protein PR003_g15997 [Phytophthora rubi]|uniref:Reverse transcriptase Ty1/copia-type domain-containing protein n=1 Tax=Phytophthora rubi TaxID=129364 RepID=A0A6A4F3A4_9STRA|nr:hypothetical protein PR003_g15997 [Phytophthora rubi]